MARQTFPHATSALPRSSSAVIYADPACKVLADIQQPAGRPIPGSKIDVDQTGNLPQFLGPDTAQVVYTRTLAGQVVPLYPVVNGSVAVNVSGAKGSNAALGSLIAALVAQGLITDSTSA